MVPLNAEVGMVGMVGMGGMVGMMAAKVNPKSFCLPRAPIFSMAFNGPLCPLSRLIDVFTMSHEDSHLSSLTMFDEGFSFHEAFLINYNYLYCTLLYQFDKQFE
jgi:hypothetical protein